MKLIAAYLLLQQGGNASPSAADIKALLETVGIEAEEDRLSKLISELEGKDINEVCRDQESKTGPLEYAGPEKEKKKDGLVIAEGASKLASVPSGGAASSASVGGAAAAAGGDAPAAEEKKEEAKEESDDDMGFGLFD
ncbi:60S acidic ribosomal protein P1 [Cryptococcus wingfieldii CBS 7118]|uniref:60S acidic ribosomal protein P1 n=1 Tax=Cryptococcus wingfieldii CBS 7118 TaxID=1295528 RepID=A0A1E3J8U8_9TREE|nr:60S acidic ribosomal protein P1 [Cryptococcus wingfieldii CBS 7118]ODN97289.1 60S acidic ribosomal protein P1 [Cryptococcus wingfieldii CBS 7118]